MTQGEEERQPAARGAAADVDRQGIELGEQGVQVIGPDLILRFVPLDDDIGGAAVAAIMQQNTVPRPRDLLGEGQDAGKIAAAAG
jgi:hypothetical protein